jgi:hypothetical protein
MAPDNRTNGPDRLDQQVSRLTEKLGQEGIAPTRDLWPGIDEAISATEVTPIRSVKNRHWGWSQIAAAAATIVVLLSAGWWSQQSKTGTEVAALDVVIPNVVLADASGLDVIDQALLELNQAMANDPENQSLANLALMLHQSRGKALRQDTALKLKMS